MNQYTELLYYIKSLGESDDFIKHVTRGDFGEVDVDKMVIPNVLNIEITSGSFSNGQTVLFDVELACLAQRDINKEVRTDDFWSNDNEVDNLNETHASLNRIWTKMHKDFEERMIKASEDPELTPVRHGTAKLFDGWRMNFSIEMPNSKLNLCQ